MMNVLVRTDASPRIGSGHLMRCAALGDRLRDNGAKVTFVMREITPTLEDLLRTRGHAIVKLPDTATPRSTGWLAAPWETDAAQTLEALDAQAEVAWLVVDHYGIDYRWEERVRRPGCRTLVIDDLAATGHDCDVLLNQNLVANAQERYQTLVPGDCHLMLGPRFALLRDEFRTMRTGLHRDPQRARKLLVFLGGADPDGVTLQVLTAVEQVRPDGLEVAVVIGADNAHHGEIEQRYGRRSNYQIIPHTTGLAKLMVDADLAVGAGGVSIWERCCLGLPSIVLAIAANQQDVSRAAAEAGACLYLGPSAVVAPEMLAASIRLCLDNAGLRALLSATGTKLVDGQGCQRVARAMLQRPLQVRPARIEDAEMMLAWRNTESTRRHSHDPQLLTREGHLRWLHDCIEDTERALLVGEDTGSPVGVLRYDISRTIATVSIYLDPALHGRGYGPQLLLAGESWLKRTRPEVTSVRAEITVENYASRRAFEEASYCERGMTFGKALESQEGQPH